MSDDATRRMISVYEQMADPTMWMTGPFQSPPMNFHAGETVEFDIERTGEKLAIVVQDLSTDARIITTDQFVNKEFTPPIIKLKTPINSFSLIKRQAGVNPFQDNDFRANAIARIFRASNEMEKQVRRTIEFEASDVWQTGTITLINENGVALYTIDFLPKPAHFPTSATAWDAVGADISGDILSLANVIREDGLADPDEIWLGEKSWEAFIKDPEIQKRYDNRRIDQGTIAPMRRVGEGGQFRGVVEIGNYSYDIWTYGGRYENPQTGVSTKFLDDQSCVVRVSTMRADATFGAIPNIGNLFGQTGPQILPELPGRFPMSGRNIDLFMNAWITPDGEQMWTSVGSRPLLIPTAIDRFGRLNTGVT